MSLQKVALVEADGTIRNVIRLDVVEQAGKVVILSKWTPPAGVTVVIVPEKAPAEPKGRHVAGTFERAPVKVHPLSLEDRLAALEKARTP